MKVILLHPLGYEDRPRGHEPDHMAHLVFTMIARGHMMYSENEIADADILIFNSGIWNTDYGTSRYNIEVLANVIERHLPVVWLDDFDHAGDDKSQGRWPGSDDWRDMLDYIKQGPRAHDWAMFGRAISRPGANRILYFMRKMQIHQDYPDYVFPLEYPIFEDYTLASKEAFCSRAFDVCGLANFSGPRAQSMIGLYRLADRRLNLDLEIIPHYRRLDHPIWIARHSNAKFFLEADASLGSERPLRLMTVAAMLRVKSDHRLPFPREDMVHMVEIGDYDGHITKADVDKLVSVLDDPDLLYSIYVAGAEHMRTHYSLEARSNYAVDKIEEFMK